jgi:hypothetical protein
MISFLSDYKKRNVYIDTSTKNDSFIKLAIVFKRMGIQNNKFHLTIYDKSLIGVDPYSKTLTSDQKKRIALEAKRNPWYYFREILKVPASGGDPVPYIINRANCAMIWLYYNHIDVFQVCPRQTGKTIATIGIFSHIMFICGKNIELSMLTMSNKLRNENVARLKEFRDSLPSYLVSVVKSDKDNIQEIEYSPFKNTYKTYAYSKSLVAADNLGRGMTSPSQHHDEFAMAYKNYITYPVAFDCTSRAAADARKNNQPCSNVITTTAGRLDTQEGRYAYEMLNKALPFREKMYDCKDLNELEELVKYGSKNRMVYTEFSFLQLGYTMEWFLDRKERKGGTQDEIEREYFNVWKHGTRQSILDQKTLTTLKDNKKEPLYVEFKGGYIFNWYVDRHLVKSGHYKNVPMVLGMDSSENIGRDFTTIVLLDARDLSVIATCRCNETNTIKLANYVADLLIEYPTITFIPERNFAGSIIDLILLRLQKAGVNPFKRIYNSVIQNRNDKEFSGVDINNYRHTVDRYRKYFGFRTTGSEYSRKYLYNTVFSKAMQLNATKIYDKTIIEEITGLVIKNGRIDHTTGGHDDMVIAYLLANYLLFAGKNLHYYGLDSKFILSKVGTEKDRQDNSKRNEQILIREQIRIIEKKMNNTNSQLLRTVMFKKLEELKKKVDDKISLPISSEISEDNFTKENFVNTKSSDYKQSQHNLREYLSVM